MTKKITVSSLNKPTSPVDRYLDAVENKKTVNHQPSKVKKTVERSSQQALKDKHRTILIKSKTDQYLKTLATIYNTSVNELVNKALDDFVSKQLQDEDISSKIKLLQEITIKK